MAGEPETMPPSAAVAPEAVSIVTQIVRQAVEGATRLLIACIDQLEHSLQDANLGANDPRRERTNEPDIRRDTNIRSPQDPCREAGISIRGGPGTTSSSSRMTPSG